MIAKSYAYKNAIQIKCEIIFVDELNVFVEQTNSVRNKFFFKNLFWLYLSLFSKQHAHDFNTMFSKQETNEMLNITSTYNIRSRTYHVQCIFKMEILIHWIHFAPFFWYYCQRYYFSAAPDFWSPFYNTTFMLNIIFYASIIILWKCHKKEFNVKLWKKIST